MILQRKDWLMKFLPARVIVNGSIIVPLNPGVPVVITVESPHAQFVISDGFHITKPFRLNPKGNKIAKYRVLCPFENNALITYAVLTAILMLMGMSSGYLALKLLAFLPILHVLYRFYISRQDFLQFREA